MGWQELAAAIGALVVGAFAWAFRHGVVRRIDELEKDASAQGRTIAVLLDRQERMADEIERLRNARHEALDKVSGQLAELSLHVLRGAE